jgi:3-hydroxyisobutyrate dehydrogenase
MRSIAVLGLGTMGSGMARRLLGGGFAVTVYNRTASRADALKEAGAKVAQTPREAAVGADVVIAMLADDVASRSAWLGENGALAGARPGAVLVESSTLSVGWVKELAAAAEALGCHLLDAPVTGSKPQAANGELLFLVGGDAPVLDSVRDVLAPMCRGMLHLGQTGSGAVMKLVNNFLCGVQAASLAEAMAMIERSGLDRAQALEMLSNGAPGSPLLRTLSARMAAQDYKTNFAVDLMAKDLAYAIEEARRHGITPETAAAALSEFRRASAEGHGGNDMSSVIEPLRRAARPTAVAP